MLTEKQLCRFGCGALADVLHACPNAPLVRAGVGPQIAQLQARVVELEEKLCRWEVAYAAAAGNEPPADPLEALVALVQKLEARQAEVRVEAEAWRDVARLRRERVQLLEGRCEVCPERKAS